MSDRSCRRWATHRIVGWPSIEEFPKEFWCWLSSIKWNCGSKETVEVCPRESDRCGNKVTSLFMKFNQKKQLTNSVSDSAKELRIRGRGWNSTLERWEVSLMMESESEFGNTFSCAHVLANVSAKTLINWFWDYVSGRMQNEHLNHMRVMNPNVESNCVKSFVTNGIFLFETLVICAQRSERTMIASWRRLLFFVMSENFSAKTLFNWSNVLCKLFKISELRKIQSCIKILLMTFKFEFFFHSIDSKEFVAQFRVRVVWNYDARVRTCGMAFDPLKLRYLAHTHRSEP
jgi:hypothetical protein